MNPREDHPPAVFEERSLFEYFFVLLKYRWLVGLIFLCVSAWSFWDFRTTPATFRTSTVMISPLVDRSSGWITLETLKDPKMQLDRLSGEVRLEIVKKLFESWDTKLLVVKELQLSSHYTEESDWLAAKKLDAAMGIELNKNESILTMHVVDQSPRMAVKIAETFIQCIRVRNNELALTSEASVVKVIDRPFLPSFRYRPTLKVSVVLAGVFTVAFSGLLIGVMELLGKLKRVKQRLVQESG